MTTFTSKLNLLLNLAVMPQKQINHIDSWAKVTG